MNGSILSDWAALHRTKVGVDLAPRGMLSDVRLTDEQLLKLLSIYVGMLAENYQKSLEGVNNNGT